MVSTANINGQEFHLILTDEGVISRSNNYNKEVTQRSVDSGSSENKLFQKVSPFYYKKRVRMTFFISDKFKDHFGLIRGLIEFHRERNLVFSYDIKNRSVGVDIKSEHLSLVQAFLSKVFDWVVKEKQFRHALKLAIEFENRYRLERDSIYGILKNTTAAQAV